MEGWIKLNDAAWQQFESIFDEMSKTPPYRQTSPQVPKAPRKAINQSRRIGLKPRKLTYEPENVGRFEEKSNNKKTVSWGDSGVVVWASSSSALIMDDVDKENRPDSEDIIPNSQVEQIRPGNLRDRLNKQLAKTTTLIISQLD